MQEALVYTNDHKVVLYKHGLKNQVADLHYVANAHSLTSKRASAVEEYVTDTAAAELPEKFGDIAAGILAAKEA